jgi:hypothetical protein
MLGLAPLGEDVSIHRRADRSTSVGSRRSGRNTALKNSNLVEVRKASVLVKMKVGWSRMLQPLIVSVATLRVKESPELFASDAERLGAVYSLGANSGITQPSEHRADLGLEESRGMPALVMETGRGRRPRGPHH